MVTAIVQVSAACRRKSVRGWPAPCERWELPNAVGGELGGELGIPAPPALAPRQSTLKQPLTTAQAKRRTQRGLGAAPPGPAAPHFLTVLAQRRQHPPEPWEWTTLLARLRRSARRRSGRCARAQDKAGASRHPAGKP